MTNFFKQQLEKSTPITEEVFNNLTNKTYTSGKEIKIGDVMLFAYGFSEPRLVDGVNTSEAKIITLTPDEIDNYEYKEETINNLIPTIKI